MSMTPEGRILAAELASPDNAHIRVAGLRACSCGRPDCSQREAGVTLSIDATTVMAMTPQAIESIVRALQQARAFVWPEGRSK